MKYFTFIIFVLLGIDGLAQSSEVLVRNGVIIVEQLDYDNYVDKRSNVLKTAYKTNQIDSLNSLSDFENKDYKGYLDMLEKLTSSFAKNNWQFKQVNEAYFDSLKSNYLERKYFFIELKMTVEQFKSGGLVLISGFNLINSNGELVFSEGPERLVKRIKKQAP